MSGNGNIKLCSEDVDCGEDHQGLDVAQGLGPGEAVDPNPNSRPASEENVGLRPSSDSESMGGEMRELQETGHLENQIPEDIFLSSMFQGGLPSPGLPSPAVQSSPHQQNFNSQSIPISVPLPLVNSLLESIDTQRKSLQQLLTAIEEYDTASTLRDQELVQRITELEVVASTLADGLETEELNNEELENKLKAEEDKNAELENKLKAEEAKNAELENKLRVEEAKNAELENKLKVEERKIAELENKLKVFYHKEEEERRRKEANQSQN